MAEVNFVVNWWQSDSQKTLQVAVHQPGFSPTALVYVYCWRKRDGNWDIGGCNGVVYPYYGPDNALKHEAMEFARTLLVGALEAVEKELG